MVASEDSSGKASSLLWLSQLRMDLGSGVLSGPMSIPQALSLSPQALAYVGDAVYELFIRSVLLLPPSRPGSYHHRVVEEVRAEQQARYLAILDTRLTPAEQDILRKGRNASPRGPKRLDPETYQQATSFETLVGYLYLTDFPRLAELLTSLPLGSTSSHT